MRTFWGTAMNNAELHERTVDVLAKVVDVLDADELALLCWHCGIQPLELMPISPSNYGFIKIEKENASERTRQAA